MRHRIVERIWQNMSDSELTTTQFVRMFLSTRKLLALLSKLDLMREEDHVLLTDESVHMSEICKCINGLYDINSRNS